MRGTFTKRTAFPLTIMLLLIVGAILINIWQTNNSIESENSRNAALIQSVNQTITNSFNESGIKEMNQTMQDLIDRIDKLLEQNSEMLKRLEANNVSGNDTTKKQP